MRDPNVSTMPTQSIMSGNNNSNQNQNVKSKNKSIGGYKIIESLGIGLTGKVYLAEKDGYAYALKKFNIIKDFSSEKQDQIQYLFEREIEFVQKLNNRNIIKYFSYDRENSFLIMEYMKGINK